MSDDKAREKAEAEVKSCYSTWATDYFANYYADPKAYPPVHRDIVRNLLQDHGVKSLLDAGCGPASMLCGLLDLGIDLYGFDLTPEMVGVAKKVMSDAGFPAERVWEGSVAEKRDFSVPGVTPDAFDAVICMGVLPHLTLASEAAALANIHAALKPGGLIAIEARNQLFSLFTLNRHSFDLFYSELIRADALRTTMADGAAFDGALDKLKAQFRMDLPPIRKGKAGEPGYDQVLSRTHNPFVLKQEVERAGFVDVEVLFYHFHCLPPMVEPLMPADFRKHSVAMEDPRDWRGHFMASAMIVTGRRA